MAILTGVGKTELVKMVSRKGNITLHDSRYFIDLVFDLMAESLANGETVTIPGFGKWKPNQRDAHVGHHPKKHIPMDVKPQIIISFKAGDGLRERVNGTPRTP